MSLGDPGKVSSPGTGLTLRKEASILDCWSGLENPQQRWRDHPDWFHSQVIGAGLGLGLEAWVWDWMYRTGTGSLGFELKV